MARRPFNSTSSACQSSPSGLELIARWHLDLELRANELASRGHKVVDLNHHLEYRKDYASSMEPQGTSRLHRCSSTARASGLRYDGLVESHARLGRPMTIDEVADLLGWSEADKAAHLRTLDDRPATDLDEARNRVAARTSVE